MTTGTTRTGAAPHGRVGSSQARAQSRREEAAARQSGRADGRAPSTGSAAPLRHVAVVGAGLAGLAAALSLKHAGWRVTVVERSRLLGGKATSFQLGDIEMDSGQHAILGCYTSFLELVEELGMGGDLRIQERFDVLMLTDRDGGRARLRALRLPAPLHLALPFLRFRALSLRSRLQVARALFAARRAHSEEDVETFAAWLRRHGQGTQAQRVFWEPFLVPALNAPFDRVSAAAGLMVVRTALLGNRDAARIGYATVPLARFAERAAERCDEVLLRTPVTGLRVEGGEIRGLLTGGAEIAVDAAVLAVPPERLLRMDGAAALGIEGLEAFTTQPIVDVHLWYEAPHPLFGDLDFAAVVGSPVQWVFAKGPGYLCCSLSSADDLVSMPEERLVALADSELRSRLPELRGATLQRGVAVRDPEATFVPAPGLRRPGPATALPNAVLAGCWTDTGWPATMEGAVRSGRTAARALVASMATLTVKEGWPTADASAGMGQAGEEVGHGGAEVRHE
jgi:squalene-associated FAD-dependent desaturase